MINSRYLSGNRALGADTRYGAKYEKKLSINWKQVQAIDFWAELF